MTYETPAITVLGSVSDFTRANFFGNTQDGARFFGIPLSEWETQGNPSVS